jgi:hypothetical protein
MGPVWALTPIGPAVVGLAQIVRKEIAEDVMPPVLALAIGLVGAAALVRWCAKEVRRVNAELDNVRGRAAAEPVDRSALPKLKHDPSTGEYRPG